MANIQTEILKRIDRIKANTHNLHNARKEIIEDMIYLEKHKVELKKTTGKTFEELKTELTGLSKRYFNQLVSNYKFLEQYKRLDLFDTADVKKIEHVKKLNKPELLNNIKDVKRPAQQAKMGDGLPVLNAEFKNVSGKKHAPAVKSYEFNFKKFPREDGEQIRHIVYNNLSNRPPRDRNDAIDELFAAIDALWK